jgi:hypothetical protein
LSTTTTANPFSYSNYPLLVTLDIKFTFDSHIINKVIYSEVTPYGLLQNDGTILQKLGELPNPHYEPLVEIPPTPLIRILNGTYSISSGTINITNQLNDLISDAGIIDISSISPSVFGLTDDSSANQSVYIEYVLSGELIVRNVTAHKGERCVIPGIRLISMAIWTIPYDDRQNRQCGDAVTGCCEMFNCIPLLQNIATNHGNIVTPRYPTNELFGHDPCNGSDKAFYADYWWNWDTFPSVCGAYEARELFSMNSSNPGSTNMSIKIDYKHFLQLINSMFIPSIIVNKIKNS